MWILQGCKPSRWGEEGGRGRLEGEGEAKGGTVGLFVLLVFPHGFEAGGAGEEFV